MDAPVSVYANRSTSTLEDDGWHSVQVFYGKLLQLTDSDSTGTTTGTTNTAATTASTVDRQQQQTQQHPQQQTQQWFSQVNQDQVVSRLLRNKRNGYFIDLAANDATTLSNTYALEQQYDWTGLCIEPNPMYWSNLTYHRQCQLVAAVVGQSRMERVMFRMDNGDHGGIVGDGFDNGKRFQRMAQPRYTVTLQEILQRFHAPKRIDYLSLDVEGAEDFIMQNFPLDQYTISLMTVERPKESLTTLFHKHGYTNIKRLSRWGETLWAHDSIRDSLDLAILEEFTPTRQPKSIPPTTTLTATTIVDKQVAGN